MADPARKPRPYLRHKPGVKGLERMIALEHMGASVAQLWLTYHEIADHLDCDAEQARAITSSKGWPRKHSSDGMTRIMMPPDMMRSYFLNAVTHDAELNAQADAMVDRLRRMLAQVSEARSGLRSRVA